MAIRTKSDPELQVQIITLSQRIARTSNNHHYDSGNLLKKLLTTWDTDSPLRSNWKRTLNEEEWLTCRKPTEMLAHLNRKIGDRKLLLYAVACCHAQKHLLPHRDSQAAVLWAELYADKLVEQDEASDFLDWRSEGVALGYEMEWDQTRFVDWCEDADFTTFHGELPSRKKHLAYKMAYFANSLMHLEIHSPYDTTLRRHESLLLLPPLHDIFGNPFHPIHLESSLRTTEIVVLANQMYESRDFSMMPALGDALQSIGCNNDQLLAHCHSNTTHVRGCWVVDLLLGKE